MKQVTEVDLDHLLKVIRRLETYQEKDEQASILQKDIKSLRDQLSDINQDLEWKDHEINDISAKTETSRQALQDISVQCSLSHVNLCLQRAEEIILELKKINTLPAIQINGQLENMVKIEFKDFSEEDKRGRMGEYITTLAQQEFDIKVLSQKLAAKYLVNRITDLDRAKVKLFKVEADSEESRYLEWKNAVGSTGQKSSLYIIFLISLISLFGLLEIRPILGNRAKFSSWIILLQRLPHLIFGIPSLKFLKKTMFS